ncbi:glycosyltransferase family 4 protein [Acidisoma cladoniae]|jgi:UDP-GlcNAc:undecaprenyl-phosphate GlcNAc-1-phosphate transferase|uniref:glycosyltransferase family 4 protein n=1 Tax=Acidisoma cladoniae TaxID=3040935 RepID=UPI00254E28C6|nr:MraY family glycosyltransferase [Acidisoma sp. PAMC 29798]
MTLHASLVHLVFLAGLAMLSAAAVRAMIGVGVMDHPSGRKAHDAPTPKMGGVGIVLAYLLGIAILYHYAGFARIADPYFRGMILSAFAIALVALLDDLYDYPFIVKLGAQIVAALTAVGGGLFVTFYRIPYVGGVDVGPFAIPFTLCWIMFATNGMNFIDGMNGLAAGVTLITCVFLSLFAMHAGAWFTYLAAALLAAGVVGFLPFNYPRARIFMGDVGSQFCGFVLAMLAVASSRFEGADLSFVLVPMMLTGALYDVGFTLVRRLLRGENITRAHRGHLFQVAQRAGMDPRLITLIYWGFTLFGAAAAWCFLAAPSLYKPVIVLVPLVPPMIWTLYVIHRARLTDVGRWSQ